MRKSLLVGIAAWAIVGFMGLVTMCHGVEWQFFNTDGDGNPMYYDLKSVENQDEEVVNVWVKHRSVGRYKPQGYGHSVSLFKIDCFRRKIISEVIVDFERDGSLLSSVASSGKPWFSITPDSLYLGLYKTVCTFKAPRGKTPRPAK